MLVNVGPILIALFAGLVLGERDVIAAPPMATGWLI